MLSVTKNPGCKYAQCRYVECHYSKCRYAECHYAQCHCPECCGARKLAWPGRELTSLPMFHSYDLALIQIISKLPQH
jgi:hypothetical protein